MSQPFKLLKSFEVSAPGKVILHGEHSVVYGQPALAGAIGLRNYIKFEETNDGIIHIVFDKINIDYKIQLTELNELLLKYTNEFINKILPDNIDHSKFLDEITQWISKGIVLNQKQINTLAPTIYLLIGILIDNKIAILKKGFKLMSYTDMSIGAGLGSSASFGVCLSATFFILTKLDAFFHNYSHYSMEDTLELQNYIIKWSFCLEKVMHGNPSGLDNTICTFGGCVTFTKGTIPEKVLINYPIDILLVDTKVTRSTSKLVADVAALNVAHPSIMKNILSAVGCLVNDALAVLTSISSINDFSNFEKLARLVRINNNLLRAIGVSHPELERIFNISEKHGFASKLTGAGGGGYAIIFLPPEYKLNTAYNQLCAELKMNHFDFIETTVGGKGVDFIEN